MAIKKKSAKKAAKKKGAKKAAKKTTKKTVKKKAKKTGKKAPKKSSAPPSPELIAQTAYLLYLGRLASGSPGDALSDWCAAEEALRAA